MPKFTFKCSLGHSIQKNVNLSVKAFPCIDELCSSTMERQLPTLNGPSTTSEVIDKYTGVTRDKDHQELVKERSDEYYWTVEVPRLVGSGIYTIETMLENGWITVDDNEKIHVNSKPPHRR